MLVSSSLIFAAPAALAVFGTLAVLKLDEQPLSTLDAQDPASWSYSGEWLPGAIVEKEIQGGGEVWLGTHAAGKWRTLRRHGSVQSVTRWDPSKDEPIHSTAGNEYIKVMASAYASLASGDVEASPLYLGLGGGTLPMLIGDQCNAIELDPSVISLATEFCGLERNLVNVINGDALQHTNLVQGSKSAIFVDVFGADNNVPPEFVKDKFVKSLYDVLSDDGVVIANFHQGSAAENKRLRDGQNQYAKVFGSCFAIPSRFQGNVIICATKKPLKDNAIDIEKAKTVGEIKRWLFDPTSRLKRVKVIGRN